MKAKVTQPIRQREVLQEAVPLEAPYYICMDVSSVCNIVCQYCVQYDLKKDSSLNFCKKIMNIELAEKIIDDLAGFKNKIKVLSLHGWGEPLLNPNLPEIVSYARRSGNVRSVETISNGILLTPDISDKLIDAGLQRINISVQAMNPDDYERICGKHIDFDKFVDNIRYLYEHKSDELTMYIKIGDIALNDEREEKLFYDTFGDICDEIYVEKIINIRDDSLANENIGYEHSSGVYGQTLRDVRVCPYLFFRMMICPDGECALCNADWYRSYSIGNASKQSVYDIWHGDRLREIQMTHLRGNREDIDLCRKCGNIKYYTNPTDNLDAVTDAIIKKLGELNESN